MKCYCCEREIKDKEINYNKELIPHGSTEPGMFEPCSTCLEVAMEAAYSNGFNIEEGHEVVVDDDFDQLDQIDYGLYDLPRCYTAKVLM